MRSEATVLIGDNLKAELAPFHFTNKNGREEIKQAPMAYIPHLSNRVEEILNRNDTRGS